MATVTPAAPVDVAGDGSVYLITWSLTSANADGSPVDLPQWADRNFTATGTWGGATLTIQGSNDGTKWVTLNTAAGGTAATATADKAMGVIEATRYIRPNLTTPGSGAAVTVSLLARRANPMRT